MAEKPWHELNPEFFRQVTTETLSEYPELRVAERQQTIFLEGPFRLIHEGREVDCFEVEIELPHDYPSIVPKVREVIGKVERTADHHCSEGVLCLFAPGERWKYWPPGKNLVDFLAGPVRSFFIGYLEFRKTGRWPFGQWSHGGQGILEAYTEMWKTRTSSEVATLLRVLSSRRPPWRRECSCGSGDRFGKCHGVFYKEWIEKISAEESGEALRILTRDWEKLKTTN